MSIQTGCPKAPCSSWVMPEGCCDYCGKGDNPEADELLEAIWLELVEWAFVETGRRFSGCCPVETEVCPPCDCICSYCDCGPLAEICLTKAFCYPIKCDKDGKPLLELFIPEGVEGAGVYGPDSGIWKLRPDLVTMEFCEIPWSGPCGAKWPNGDFCNPWTIRAVVGEDPPGLLLRGLAKLACEMVKDCLGEDNCLPDGVRSITRRGVTQDFGEQLSETISFENSGTGIPALDLALRRWGLDGLPEPVQFFDPLVKLHEKQRRDWQFRGVLAPTPPTGFTPAESVDEPCPC